MFTVISDLEVCGKTKGDSLTEKELEEAGANIEALISAGHIQTVIIKQSVSAEGAK